jgi:glycosyltransferase involved in cell wall biosynthesis
MSHSTKLSIITVTFNSSKTISDTLRSVESQDYPNIEYIVIDGGSSDETLDMVRASGRVDQLLSEPDHGIYDAMNKGLKIASGDVIGFLHSDDVYAHSGVLSEVVCEFDKSNLDALYADIAYFASNNPSNVVRMYRSHRFSPKKIAWGWMPAHPSLFLRKGVYDTFGLFKTDYKIAGDYEYVARIFHADTLKYSYLPQALVKMRMGGVSTGGLKNSLILNQEVLRACKENGISTNWLKILSKYPAKLIDSLIEG